ncbi:P-type conjugative transfer protein TrbJ [Ferrovibrio sp.]|jgi:P-type conjugative transfer protein TrbJ|uniref:P-type conjugative transfer protein TrbJ n=1 Tax=Ferrovibrio sp. TaxID=1917215 RepID=UPI00311EE714
MKRYLIVSLVAGLLAASSARALTVFDPSNYAQNVLQAARALQQINNQIQGLQNQVLMLQNQARNLQRMDYSSLYAIQSGLGRITSLMRQADGIAFDLQQTDRAFADQYPQQYGASVAQDQLSQDARRRWENSVAALHQTMRVQAQVSANIDNDAEELGRLVGQSDAALGNLQVSQATNQLIALSAKQQLQAQGLAAAQYRADALEKARAAMAQEQARASFDQFMGSSDAYPGR